MSDIKIVFFDMEGTLFRKAVRINETSVASSAWVSIAKALGPQALKEEHQTQKNKREGRYSNYIEWMMDTIRIHKKYKLTKRIFNEVIDAIPYMPGVHEVFSKIRRLHIPTCLISGGFKNQGDKAIRDLKIDHGFVACEYFFDDEGLLDHYNLLPGDEEGKVDFLKLMMREYGLAKEHCAFVGDGMNDVFIAQQVGVSVAFNADEELKKVATCIIDQEAGAEDFRDVLNCLGLA